MSICAANFLKIIIAIIIILKKYILIKTFEYVTASMIVWYLIFITRQDEVIHLV